jgi:hypothetical protein
MAGLKVEKAFVIGDLKFAKQFTPQLPKDVDHAEDWKDMNGMPKPEGGYDLIVLADSLQRLRKENIGPMIFDLLDAMHEGSEMIVAMPSLEWICDHIDDKTLGIPAYIALFGGAYPSGSAMLLNWIRVAMRSAGMAIRKATRFQTEWTFEPEGKIPVLYNLVIGLKTEAVEPFGQ